MKEINFKDRVPTYPGRITLTPVAGQANTYDLKRADMPIVEGSPIDKATYNSMVHSRLTGRYYTPTVTRKVSAGRSGLTVSPLPTSGWVFDEDTTSKATSGAYLVETSSDQAAYSLADEAFTSGGWQSGNNSSGAWIRIYHTQPMKVHQMSFRLETRYAARLSALVIEGSTNGTAWTELHKVTNITLDTNVSYSLTRTGDYTHYRIRFEFSDSNNVTVSNLKYSLYDISSYINEFTVAEGFPGEWTDGQRVMLIAPANVDAFAIANNTLNGVPISGILQKSKFYELIYSGGLFVAMEV